MPAVAFWQAAVIGELVGLIQLSTDVKWLGRFLPARALLLQQVSAAASSAQSGG